MSSIDELGWNDVSCDEQGADCVGRPPMDDTGFHAGRSFPTITSDERMSSGKPLFFSATSSVMALPVGQYGHNKVLPVNCVNIRADAFCQERSQCF